MKLGGLPLLALAALLLSGCAGSTSYASTSELVKAYVAAGNECPSPADVPESMLSEGAHGALCPDVTMLIVFDTDEAKNRYLARTLDGSNGLEAVAGERWVIMSDRAEDIAAQVGGTVEKG